MKVEQKEWYRLAKEDYNAMAKLWNSLPGKKLIWPKDRFGIQYCYHKSPPDGLVSEGLEIFKNIPFIPVCKACGLPRPQAYDD